MTSLLHRSQGATPAVGLTLPRVTQAPEPHRRSPSVMRKYDVCALLPDLTITRKQHVAPATALFEETAGAFARGTLIQTVSGAVAIEDLMPGDYVATSRGAEAVVWIGSTTFVPGVSDTNSTLTQLTRIATDGFGMGRPMSDILIGPAARLVMRRERLRAVLGQEAVLAPVQDYADGDRIFNVSPAGAVQMYHVMLRRHGIIRVGGIEMDSYHPGKALNALMSPNLRALYLSMFPNVESAADFGALSLPRTTREVIDGLA